MHDSLRNLRFAPKWSKKCLQSTLLKSNQNPLYAEFFQDLGIEDVLHVQESKLVKLAHSVRAHIRHRNIIFAPSGTLMPCGGPIAALYGFGKKFGRKINENLPNFFSEKNILKRVQKPSFIKNALPEPIFAQKLQDMKISLPPKMAPTIGLHSRTSAGKI